MSVIHVESISWQQFKYINTRVYHYWNFPPPSFANPQQMIEIRDLTMAIHEDYSESYGKDIEKKEPENPFGCSRFFVLSQNNHSQSES